MSVTSGVAAGRVLRNEPLITIPRQAPKEHPVTNAALAIERQLYAVRVWDNVTVVARAAVARIFSEIGVRFEIILTPVIAILELVRIVEQRVLSPVKMEDGGRVSNAKQQGRAGGSVDDAVPSIQWRREEATLLPLESLLLVRIVAAPDLRRATALEHIEELFVHVFFRSNGTGTSHLDDVDSLEPAATIKLDKRALSAHPLPRSQSQVANIVESDSAAMDGEFLLLHVNLIGSGLPYPTFRTNKILLHSSLPPVIVSVVALRAASVRLYPARSEDSSC